MKQTPKTFTLAVLTCCFICNVTGQFIMDDSTGLPMQIAPLKSGEYYVPTIYNDINHSFPWLQDFFDNELNMMEYKDFEFSRIADTTEFTHFFNKRFVPAGLNEADFMLTVKYDVFSVVGRYIVKKLVIRGDIESVADIFFDCYATAKKKEHGFYTMPKIVNHLPDQITFYKETEKGREIGIIEIEPFNNMTWEEYAQMVKAK